MDLLKSRRRFLQGLAAVSVYGSLGPFGLSRMALAGQTEQAKLKVVFVVVPDGLAVDSYTGGGFGDGRGLWHPTAQDVDTSAFTLNEISAELAAYRDQSLYLRGIMLGPGNVGHSGWNWVLRDTHSSQSSIDILLGNHLPGTEASHRSLFAGPHAGVDGTPWFVSFQDKAIRTPYRDPVLMAEALFKAPVQKRNPDGRPLRNRSFLDMALLDIREILSKLSGAEHQKLVTHLDSVEQVIKDLEMDQPPIGECKPVTLEPLDFRSARDRTQVQANHHQVVATALGCGITRVATIQIGRSAESLNIIDVSTTSNPHDCAHRYSGEPFWKGTRQWYVRQVKRFMDELARYQDPHVSEDSLLDHTLVVLTSEMADGAPEHMIDMPMVLMGGASGLLKSGDGDGRYFNITGQADRDHHSGNPVIGRRFVDMQRIWATVAKAAGTTVPYEGNIEPVTGIFTNV